LYEIEIKILGIDREKVEKKLMSLGAEKTFDDEINAVYYDDRRRSIEGKRGTLRLRKEGARSVFTFKAFVENEDAKVRAEKEVSVSDFAAMQSILESLGFVPWLEMRKHRITYEIAGVHFEFDKYLGEYDYIPEFLEIESGDVGTVLKYAELLGFTKEDCKPWDALEVARYYSRRGTKT
jgi:predicted adenylyl cyclase CyaB